MPHHDGHTPSPTRSKNRGHRMHRRNRAGRAERRLALSTKRRPWKIPGTYTDQKGE